MQSGSQPSHLLVDSEWSYEQAGCTAYKRRPRTDWKRTELGNSERFSPLKEIDDLVTS